MDPSRHTNPAAWPPPRPRSSPSALPPADLHRRWPALSTAAWLASAGASMLLVASVVVVAGNWQAIDPIVRFSGLVAALVAVFFVAEAGRRRSPTTSTALATLAATLTAPVGVAAMATIEQPWPICVLVGGVAALSATELQSRRWEVPALKAATVVAFGLAAVGAAALTGVPVSAIGAVGAVVALLCGATRRSVVLGVAVGVTPLLVAVADAGIGAGTLARIGATGSDLAWSAPLACIVAAIVLAIVAGRRHNEPLAIAAVGVAASGLVTGLLASQASPAVWWALPAIALLALEAVGAVDDDSVWRALARRTSDAPRITIVGAALITPYLGIMHHGGNGRQWMLPLVLTALALVAAACGSARRATGDAAPAVAAIGAAACVVAAIATTPLPLWVASVAALVGWAAASLVTPWRWWDAATATAASWVLLTAVVGDGPPTMRLGFAIAAGMVTVVSLATADRADAGFRLIVVAMLVGFTVGVIGGRSDLADIELATLTVLGLIAIGVGLRPAVSAWPLGFASYVTFQMVSQPDPTWFDVVATGLLAVAFAVSSRGADSVRAHLAAALSVCSIGLLVSTADLDATAVTFGTSVAAIGLTGLSLVDRRLTALRAAGLTASLLAVVASLSTDAAMTSLAVTVFGVLAALVGVTLVSDTNVTPWPRGVAALPGAVVAGIGIGSLWWTSGANDRVIDQLAPYGVTGSDLALAAATVVLLVGGGAARRVVPVSSWLAFGPGLALAATWLISSQLEAGTDWATFGALVVGVSAMAIGGVRRLAAPLVIGTATVLGTIVVSAGPRLATAPTWSWIAVGGTSLLIVAAIVERSERPLLPIGRRAESERSLLEQFCDEFE